MEYNADKLYENSEKSNPVNTKKKKNINQLFHVITNFNKYKCFYSGCDKSFNEKGSLKVHMKTHVQLIYILI